MKSLQDRVGCHSLQCCRAAQCAADQREICHQHKRHFLGAGTKVRMECVRKKCQNENERMNRLGLVFFDTTQAIQSDASTLCDLWMPAPVSQKSL